MCGCTIFSNLYLVRDVLDMISKTDEPGILVKLDEEKAFDRVYHEFLMRVLTKFGFGPTVCHWIAIFYNVFFLVSLLTIVFLVLFPCKEG